MVTESKIYKNSDEEEELSESGRFQTIAGFSMVNKNRQKKKKNILFYLNQSVYTGKTQFSIAKLSKIT